MDKIRAFVVLTLFIKDNIPIMPWKMREEAKMPRKFPGDVYYDPRTNQFLQLRQHDDNYLVFGSFTYYYEDAKTTTLLQHLPLDYLKGLKKVGKIEELEEAEYRPDIGYWRIKGERIMPTPLPN